MADASAAALNADALAPPRRGQPACIPGPLPANCTYYDGGRDQNTFCASYCVERGPFLDVPGKGGWHDPDMLIVGNTPCSPADRCPGRWRPSPTIVIRQCGH